MDKKKKLDEGLLDTALKGIVGIFFAGKLIKGEARKRALKDPKVKQAMKNVKDQMSKLDQALEKSKQDYKDKIKRYS